MRPLRYALNITLDGCYDHRAAPTSEEIHHFWADETARADALLLGRVTYQMMEEAWRPFPETGVRPEWMEPWMDSFAHAIHRAKKYVVSSTLDDVDWNAELVRGDPGTFARRLKEEPGTGVSVAGVQLAFALSELGLIDEYLFVVHPRITGHGPTLFAGLTKSVDLRLVDRREFASGAVALRYERVG